MRSKILQARGLTRRYSLSVSDEVRIVPVSQATAEGNDPRFFQAADPHNALKADVDRRSNVEYRSGGLRVVHTSIGFGSQRRQKDSGNRDSRTNIERQGRDRAALR